MSNRRPGDFNIDVVDFLTSLGVRNVTPQGDEVIFSCPFGGHKNGDRTPSASMNARTTQFLCWGCKTKGNAMTFLALTEGVSPIVAKRWLRERWGATAHEPKSGSMVADLKRMFAEKLDEPELEPERIPDEWKVDEYKVHWDLVESNYDTAPPELRYMLDRGFRPTTLSAYEVGYDYACSRVVLPIRDEWGTLIGFKGRAVDPETKPRYKVMGGKYQSFTPYKTERILYLANTVTPDNGNIIVCEGELNALMMRQHGFHNAVGISGSTFSIRQGELCRRLASSVTLFFDSDDAGLNGQAKAAETLSPFMPVYVLPIHDTDAAASTQDEVRELLDHRQSYLITQLQN